jgi:hypothetical protein
MQRTGKLTGDQKGSRPLAERGGNCRPINQGQCWEVARSLKEMEIAAQYIRGNVGDGEKREARRGARQGTMVVRVKTSKRAEDQSVSHK